MGEVTVVNGIHFTHKVSNYIPTGQCYVFKDKDLFRVTSREHMNLIEILAAISKWIEKHA